MVQMYGECPKCHHQCWIDGTMENIVGIVDRHSVSTDYGPGEGWIETWRCPKCLELFQEENGYP